MDLLFLILRSLIPLFTLIGLGYGLKRWSLMKHEHAPVLNGLVVNVLLPASILGALLKAPALTPHLALPPLLLLAAELIMLGLWLGVGRAARLPGGVLGAAMLAGVFGNTAFLGYPIAQTLLPRQFPAAVMLDEFGMMIFLYPTAAALGAWFMARDQRQESLGAALRRVLRGPLFLAIISGIILRALPLPEALTRQAWAQALGGVAMQILTYLGQATTAVVLLALGIALEPRARASHPGALWIACGMKLLLCPALMAALCRLAGVGGELRLAAILQASMPTAVLAAVLARQHGLDARFAVRVVFITTALSAVTIPLVMALAQ